MTPKFELPNKKIPFQKVRFLWNFDRRLLSLVLTSAWNLKVLPCREPKWRRFCHSATSFGMKNRLEWKIPFQKVRFLWNFDRRVLSLVLTIAWNLKVLPCREPKWRRFCHSATSFIMTPKFGRGTFIRPYVYKIVWPCHETKKKCMNMGRQGGKNYLLLCFLDVMCSSSFSLLPF